MSSAVEPKERSSVAPSSSPSIGPLVYQPPDEDAIRQAQSKRPLVLERLPDPLEVRDWMTKFKQIKGACLEESDYAVFSAYNRATKQNEEKKALKRSGFEKLASFLRISDGEVRVEIKVLSESPLHYLCMVQTEAFTPSGRKVIGLGVCSNTERDFGAKEDHIVCSIAATRSKNRAYADAMGSADVSAEELSLDEAVKTAQTYPADDVAGPSGVGPATSTATVVVAAAATPAPQSERCDKCNIMVSRHPVAKDGGVMVDKFCAYNPDQVWGPKVRAMLQSIGASVDDYTKFWRKSDQEKTWVKQ